MTLLAGLLLALLAGSWVYCCLILIAVRQFQRSATASLPAGRALPAISVLKPLSGREPHLEDHLRSYFEQRYSQFELIFAVRDAGDPAVAVVHRLLAAHPQVPARLLITGEAPIANAKVFSLARLVDAARFDALVMSDSDVSVRPDFLAAIAGEFAAEKYDLATCFYRAVPAPSLWSTLEAVGLNTSFWASALVARLIEGVKFTVGPTVVARREVFNAIPWPTLGSYLAEDFALGQRAAAAGFRVDFSGLVVDHHIGGAALGENFSHRLRWARSTRHSRPAGYVGVLFTNPLPLVLVLLIVYPALWFLLPPTVALRAAAAHATSERILHDPLCRRRWWLIPVEDLLAFGFWLAGFVGRRIRWRGREYLLNRDGTFAPVRFRPEAVQDS